jgi:hypothetical protein
VRQPEHLGWEFAVMAGESGWGSVVMAGESGWVFAAQSGNGRFGDSSSPDHLESGSGLSGCNPPNPPNLHSLPVPLSPWERDKEIGLVQLAVVCWGERPGG